MEDERRLVPAIICSLLRNQPAQVTRGEQIRDFLHVEDVARAICTVAQSNICGPINIGSGRPVAVRDIATQIGLILNRTDLIALGALPYSPHDPPFLCANNRRLIENTSWKPRYDLEQGLRHTIAWWQKHLGVS
jgi:nucleoside-diphosphate-sugar epimerase